MAVSKKVIFLSFGVLLALLVGGLYVSQIQQNSGALIQPRTAEIASAALGVSVSIGGMDLSLKDGRAQFSDIRITNPDGFTQPEIFRIEGVNVRWESVSKDLVEITSLETYGTEIFFEINEAHDTNLFALKRKINDAMVEDSAESAYPLNVILRKGVINAPVLYPAVTYMEPDDAEPLRASVYVSGDGEALEAGVAQNIIGQVMLATIQHYEEEAARAGFYHGLSKDAVQGMGVNEVNRFTGQLRGEFDQVKDGLKGVLKSFQEE